MGELLGKTKEWLQKLLGPQHDNSNKKQDVSDDRRSPRRRPLVASRRSAAPMELVEDSEVVGHTFERLRRMIFSELEKAPKTILDKKGRPVARAKVFFKEHGRLRDGRAYFYIKPENEIGYVFEESSSGWVISRSQKIVAQDLFIRSSDIWDRVLIYDRPQDSSSFGVIVESSRYAQTHMSMLMYQQRLVQGIKG